jgi:hypothetical protein
MKSILLFAAVAAATAAHNPALVARGLSPFGGYAIIATTCPSGTSTCGSKYCCPTGTTCDATTNTGEPVCCPTSMSP